MPHPVKYHPETLYLIHPDYYDLDPNVEAERSIIALTVATNAALKSAVTLGMDLPIGAVAYKGDKATASAYARDNELGAYGGGGGVYNYTHAEYMAFTSSVGDWLKPNTVATTLEPCKLCMTTLYGKVKEFVYLLDRNDVSGMGLINPGDMVAEDYSRAIGDRSKFTRVDDLWLRYVNLILLSLVERDKETGEVTVDREGVLEFINDENARWDPVRRPQVVF